MPDLEIISPRMLVVDDIADNREVLRRSFERRGYEVIEATDGTSALALIGEQRFDIVMLDIMMPGTSGIEVLKHIRRQFSPGKLPVIMVTARSGIADVVEALECGANDYLTKPVALPIAHARVAGQLACKRAEDAHQRAVAKLAETVRELQSENLRLRLSRGETSAGKRLPAMRSATQVHELSIPVLLD